MRKNFKSNGYHTFDFEKDVKKEEFTQPSLTVPHHTMSLKELVDRFTRGDSINILRPDYAIEDEEYDELDLIDITRLDEIEKLEFANDLKNAIQDEKRALIARAERKAEKERSKKIGKRAVEAMEKVLGIYEEPGDSDGGEDNTGEGSNP